LHICNELSTSSFGFEGHFVSSPLPQFHSNPSPTIYSNPSLSSLPRSPLPRSPLPPPLQVSQFYPASVVSSSNCIVAKADCRVVLSLIQNVDFIDALRTAALARTQWLAMRSHQAVQVLGVTKLPPTKVLNYFQNIQLQSWLGSRVYPPGPYRKALMNKEDYDAIALRWKEARQVLQQDRMKKFLSPQNPLPQVACLNASSVQSSAVRSKQAQKKQNRLESTRIHRVSEEHATQKFREPRAKPWIAEATAIMQVRKSMNPTISAADMLRTSSCSKTAAQGFSKVGCIYATYAICDFCDTVY
jgi:hypothetical protein